jgi:proteasome inhibitor subunit 1 (PI31)
MIFDPFRAGDDRRMIPGNLPRGAVPPGARFDPFGPPDPDSLRPNRAG